MTEPEPTVASTLADTVLSLAGLGAMQTAVQGEPPRLDVIVHRDALTARTVIHGYLDGRAAARAESRFNPAEPRLHLHVIDSGSPSSNRSHAWAQTTQDTPGAPHSVANHRAKLAGRYHPRGQGCADCGYFAHLPDAPTWTVVLDGDTQIDQIRRGLLSRREANALALTGRAHFVVTARSLPSAHNRALAVLDDFHEVGGDIADHLLVDAEATEGRDSR
ncbi:hypothetical protein [Kitasatospora brasiliensis]|uniref:hypothetical protein n=1 Tax=Kitasatospora brasiliensis TaxID=3058040 RepID=UPI00292CBBE7|nr:hypothetical protein [Kitasatospora sp. K002]